MGFTKNTPQQGRSDMKKILVSGAAGYIGSILCPKLLKKEYKVYGVDNFRFNQAIPHCFKSGAYLYLGDVTQKDTLRDYINKVRPDVIIHLSALVGMPICLNNPAEAVMVNTESTRLLLEIIKDTDIKLLTANTNSQYGTQPGICTEESPTNPISLYSVTKCISEALVLNRPNSTCLRLATVYGVSKTRMRDELLLNFFVKSLVQNGTLELYQPEFMRGAVHIEDVSNAFIHAIENNLTGVYNVGDDNLNMTKLKLAQKVADIVGGRVTIGEGEDIDKRDYNVSSAKIYATGFQIQTDFEDNIRELADYYNNT